MTKSTYVSPMVKPPFQPTEEQLERESSLRRFNRLYIYTPVIIISTISLLLVISLLWAFFYSDTNPVAAQFVSGLADLIIIMWTIPMLLLCFIGPVSFVMLLSRGYRRSKLDPALRRNKLQVLLWQLDQLLAAVHEQLRDNYLPKLAGPLAKGHAIAAYIQAVFNYIFRIGNDRNGRDS